MGRLSQETPASSASFHRSPDLERAKENDQLPAAVESKRLHYGANEPLSKGNDRYDKHSRQKESDIERYATEGASVDLQPIVDSRGKKQN
ncbi:hypothetical protein B0J14DRAFT_701968 [Halenospora varia]|nr:hypothetical protein B0J14DRAFT_701968 [Halenospora varia]